MSGSERVKPYNIRVHSRLVKKSFGEAAETYTRAARAQAGKLCAPNP